jgi:DNA-binding PadR family transcriptional regulator
MNHLWLGRMRHGPGGGFFSHRGGFGGGNDDFSRGRKFSSDDLQILLLALLADTPRHGYELIKLLETRSNGFYTPSPGMVYPALTYLEELGYTSVETEGNRKRYALTDTGRAYLEANRERVEMIWAKLSFFARKMGMVRRALAGEDPDESVGTHPLKALLEARHELKHLLFDRMEASPEEQARIAAILQRAVAEIEADPTQSK